jgi:hypothetical protein
VGERQTDREKETHTPTQGDWVRERETKRERQTGKRVCEGGGTGREKETHHHKVNG